MSDIDDLIEVVRQLRRDHDAHVVATRNMLRVGPVTDRDHEKGFRVDHSDDGTDKSDWVQPSERSGREREVPDLKEQWLVIAPYGGDGPPPIAIPYGHTKEKPNPATHADETVIFNKGKVRHSVDNKTGVVTIKNDKSTVTMTGDDIKHDVDGNTTEHTKAETKFGKGGVKHDKKNIGKDHVHAGVKSGDDKTRDPEE